MNFDNILIKFKQNYFQMRHFNFKNYLLILICILIVSPLFSQDNELQLSDKKFRLDLEPATLFLGGAGLSLMYALDEEKKLNLGVYFLSCDVPNFSKKGIFENVNDDTDIRIGFEFALTGRYKLELFKNMESNPYIGFIFGWQFFDIKQPTDMESFRTSTWIFTPYLGYEIYLYKQMLYVHPHLRGVLYFGSNHEIPTRPEKLSKTYLLPQIGLGVRL